jgi:hypothetical protein
MKIPFALALLVLPTGCPLLELDANVSEVCVTYSNVQIDAVTGDHVQASVTIDDLGQLQDLVGRDSDLRFVRAELRGASSLSFVSAAEVSIASGDPASTLPTLSIVACDGDCLADGSALGIPAAVQHSAVAYVKTGSLVIDLDLRGQLPAQAWTADVDVCMTGHLQYAVEP